MGLFGKNEAELKQIARDLEQQEERLQRTATDLDSQRSKIEHERKLLEIDKSNFKGERDAFREEARKTHEGIQSEISGLTKREFELLELEAEAKAGFAEKQREAFKSAKDKFKAELNARQKDLDAQKKELDTRERQLSEKSSDLNIAEAKIFQRELALVEREQKADAGFADKAKALADEAARQHHANQVEAERLRKLAITLAENHQRIEETKAGLVVREQAIVVAEQKVNAGFADERAALIAELRGRRALMESEVIAVREKALSTLEDEIANLKAKRMEEIAKAEQAERDRIRTEIASERKGWERQQEGFRQQLEAERMELGKQKGAISALQSELEGRKTELEANERILERNVQRLERQWQKKNDDLDSEIEARLEEERQSFETAKQTSKDENARLRDALRIQDELDGVCEQLKRQFGDKDPAEILRDLNSKTDELKRLREELATRPTEEMREKYREKEAENQRMKAQIEKLDRQINDNASMVAKSKDLERENNVLKAENDSLVQKASIFEGAAKEATEELKRLRAAYERPAEIAARYNEVEMPHIKATEAKRPDLPNKDSNGKIIDDENDWLRNIENKCDEYDLHFNPRILKAFHTALKTAEWSPLTVLAGVSGTGKSELPRLYSHFGGLMFEPLSVQPNWDSQESMLGFFNSIDNKFDAQPVLRFLAQSQQPASETYEKRIARWQKMADNKLKFDPEKDKELIETLQQSDYPGLEDCVCLVLLDEMNLAHPELYFAEFLSKLELRRGMKGKDVPRLPVKIGAGLPPYQLPLGRNVLWTGTMNQDETTKSLSDKVLDRSIIIHFPRPTELKRRLKLVPLDEKNRGNRLHKGSWQSWLAPGSSFTDEQVKPYKEFIQNMNKALAVAGRAIGHRVWQSIEYYMANYPDVRAAQKTGDQEMLNKALHIAFEDQLVQKVMPKLRGIDTRGEVKSKCLDKIRDQINTGIKDRPFNLEDDFKLACDLGYGQFIWQSANYLNENETNAESANSEIENIDTARTTTTGTDSNPISVVKEESTSKPYKNDKKRK